jgi:GWxTD domain-containing protein
MPYIAKIGKGHHSKNAVPFWLISIITGLLAFAPVSGAGIGQEDEVLQQEEAEDYFQKWLDEDVVYIITDEERSVFENLTTPEEKEQFIEQFWFRRDPDVKSAVNEYKIEHYRRLAYVNEKYSVGMPGWMSDRGKIYIIHGPPAQIEAHPTGGQYQRPISEGGGWTQAYPWERWRYRHIEGIGDDIEIEFVDKSMTGQYRLALNPEEKDSLLQLGKHGATLFEIFNQEYKRDRPYINPLNRDRWNYLQRQRDMAFERYLTYARMQGAQEIKFNDLKELVKVEVTYEKIPLDARIDYFRLNENQVLVPITFELKDKDLSFLQKEEGYLAEVAIYGIVTSLSNRIIDEFEDELMTGYSLQEGQTHGTGGAMYQKILILENESRYKLTLVAKDLNSGNVGVVRKAIIPPKYSPDSLGISSVLLSSHIYLLDELPEENSMFVLGDLKIRPSLDNVFADNSRVAVYLQAYHSTLDQTSMEPSIRVTSRISRDGNAVVELLDDAGEAVQYYNSERAVLIQELPVAGLEAGNYQLEIELEDRIGNKIASTKTDFEVIASVQSQSSGG